MSRTGVERVPVESSPGLRRVDALRHRLGRTPAGLVDVGTALVVAVVVSIEAALPSDLHHGSTVLSLIINVAAALTLVLRRHAPVLTLGLISAILGLPTVVAAHDLSFWGVMLCFGLSHYMIVRLRPVRVALLSLLLPLAGAGLYWWLTPTMRGDVGLFVFLLLIFGTTLVAGRLVCRDADRRRELSTALARLADEEESRHRLAVLDERTALARDLHDVVAHALSLMNVSAERARGMLATDQDAALHAMRTLETAGRDATADLRRMLGLLRENDGAGSATEPTPGFAQLPGLIERMRAAGLQITYNDDLRTPSGWPAGLELAVLRIVGEALTNVLRHAGPTRVVLRLGIESAATPTELTRPGDRVIIDVIDDGPRPGPPGQLGHDHQCASGHGLIGMRERAGLYDGVVRAGPRGNGFAVHAELRLPVPSEPKPVRA